MRKRTLLIALGTLSARPAWSLYDPPPSPLLASSVGSWAGTLVYRDYQNPDRRVTLRARMTATLVAPDELALYYAFDDGPGKIVFSYERMRFDFAKREMEWMSGTAKPERNLYRTTTAETPADLARIHFERAVEGGEDRYTLEVTNRSWSLSKVEVRSGKANLERNRYEFARSGA
jgi:hypothetical protein